jgi:hypothetical protein
VGKEGGIKVIGVRVFCSLFFIFFFCQGGFERGLSVFVSRWRVEDGRHRFVPCLCLGLLSFFVIIEYIKAFYRTYILALGLGLVVRVGF